MVEALNDVHAGNCTLARATAFQVRSLQEQPMEAVTPHLTALILDTVQEPDWYEWRMPNPKGFPMEVALPRGPRVEQTRALKHALSEKFDTCPNAERFELARYFVRHWGGIRGNREATLQRYVLADTNEIIRSQKFKGISTWSKVLHLRDPHRYFIYDSRIAVSLNLLQITSRVQNPLAFPMPESQSRLIKTVRNRLRAIAREASWRRATDTFYEDYNTLLRRVASQIGIDTDIVEMALFSRAPFLAGRLLNTTSAMAKHPST